MHAAQAAGGEYVDPGAMREQRRRRHRGPPVQSLRRRDRQVADTKLDDRDVLGTEHADLLFRQTDRRRAVDNPDGRGQHPGIAQTFLGLEGDLDVAWPGEAVCEDRRFERHDRPSGRDRFAHVVRDADRFAHTTDDNAA